MTKDTQNKKANLAKNLKRKENPKREGMADRKRKMLKALSETLGIVTSACQKVNIERATHYRWLRDDPEYRASVEDINDQQIDFVESQLVEQIKSGDTTATIFYLKTKGKERGYTERRELTGRDGANLIPPARVLSVEEAKAMMEDLNRSC